MILRRTALALGLLAPATAFAHSTLTASVPADASRLSAAPTEFVLRFNEMVQVTALTLVDGEGRRLRLVLPRDTTPRAVERLAAPPLAPGSWRLEWRAISADGHPVRGTIRFAVEAPR